MAKKRRKSLVTKADLAELKALAAGLERQRQANDKFWPRIRQEIKDGKLFYGYGKTAIPGTVTIEATHQDCCMPLGIVWYRWISENQIDIVYSYVRPSVRRCGVRTYLHQRLLACYPHARITTNSGTTEGMQWMSKTGYKFNPPGEWVFERCSQNAPASTSKKCKSRSRSTAASRRT